jgi:hypothetical protein
MRILALNLNHRSLVKPVAPELVAALLVHRPEVLVLTEYVEPQPRQDLRAQLAAAGLEHVAVSDAEKEGAYWANQVLVASAHPIKVFERPPGAPDASARTNILVTATQGLRITGLRAPMYEAASDWYRYWDWLTTIASGDVIVGDLNTDPGRNKARDRVLGKLISAGGWARAEPDGAWSYMGKNGNSSRVDQVVFRGPVKGARATYVVEPFWPTHSDHAAIVVDLER